MRMSEIWDQSAAIIFNRLMEAEEGQWVTVTRTKGRNRKGQRVVLEKVRGMCTLMQITIEVNPVTFSVRKPTSISASDYMKMLNEIRNKNVLIQGRRNGKSTFNKQLVDAVFSAMPCNVVRDKNKP